MLVIYRTKYKFLYLNKIKNWDYISLMQIIIFSFHRQQYNEDEQFIKETRNTNIIL